MWNRFDKNQITGAQVKFCVNQFAVIHLKHNINSASEL